MNKIQKQASQIYVGTFNLGRESVELFAMTKEVGGCFYFQPEENALGRIKVGIEYPKFDYAVAVLLHEATEYSMAKHLLRFESCSPSFSRENSAYLFVMDHQKFSGVCYEVSQFITPAMPALELVFNKLKKKRKL